MKQSYKNIHIWIQPNILVIFIFWNLFSFRHEIYWHSSFQNQQPCLFVYYWLSLTYPKISKPPTPILSKQMHIKLSPGMTFFEFETSSTSLILLEEGARLLWCLLFRCFIDTKVKSFFYFLNLIHPRKS